MKRTHIAELLDDMAEAAQDWEDLDHERQINDKIADELIEETGKFRKDLKRHGVAETLQPARGWVSEK